MSDPVVIGMLAREALTHEDQSVVAHQVFRVPAAAALSLWRSKKAEPATAEDRARLLPLALGGPRIADYRPTTWKR